MMGRLCFVSGVICRASLALAGSEPGIPATPSLHAVAAQDGAPECFGDERDE